MKSRFISILLIILSFQLYSQISDTVSDSPLFQQQLESSLNGEEEQDNSDIVYLDEFGQDESLELIQENSSKGLFSRTQGFQGNTSGTSCGSGGNTTSSSTCGSDCGSGSTNSSSCGVVAAAVPAALNVLEALDAAEILQALPPAEIPVSRQYRKIMN